MEQGLNVKDTPIFNDEQKSFANIILEDSYKQDLKSTAKVEDTATYLQEAKQASKTFSRALGMIASHKKGETKSEEVEKHLATVRELHDNDLAQISQKLNSTEGLDLLEKLLTERSKMNNESVKRGKLTEDESMIYQALFVHDLLASVTTMEATGDLDKANRYFREFYPSLTDVGTRQYCRIIKDSAISLLSTEGVKVKGAESELS